MKIQIDRHNFVRFATNSDLENKTASVVVVKIEGGTLFCENMFHKAEIEVDNPQDFQIGMRLKLTWK